MCDNHLTSQDLSEYQKTIEIAKTGCIKCLSTRLDDINQTENTEGIPTKQQKYQHDILDAICQSSALIQTKIDTICYCLDQKFHYWNIHLPYPLSVNQLDQITKKHVFPSTEHLYRYAKNKCIDELNIIKVNSSFYKFSIFDYIIDLNYHSVLNKRIRECTIRIILSEIFYDDLINLIVDYLRKN